MELRRPAKARPGDKVAVLSPSFAAPGEAPAVHEQAMRRLTEVTGLVPVEYPTTRAVGASARDRAADLNAAFADPEIRAVLATIGGEDQITVDPAPGRRRGPGRPEAVPGLQRQHQHPVLAVDPRRRRLLRRLDPGAPRSRTRRRRLPRGGAAGRAAHRRAARDHRARASPRTSARTGQDPRPSPSTATASRPSRGPGPARQRSVTGRTWGGCIEVIQWILTAGRFPADPAVLDGGVLLLESSEDLIPAQEFGWILRSLGERGLLDAVDAVLVARPPASNFDRRCRRGRAGCAPAGPARHRDRGHRTGTTPTPSSASASRSATPGRSGSSRTAATSPSTAPASGSGPTTADRGRPGPGVNVDRGRSAA